MGKKMLRAAGFRLSFWTLKQFNSLCLSALMYQNIICTLPAHHLHLPRVQIGGGRGRHGKMDLFPLLVLSLDLGWHGGLHVSGSWGSDSQWRPKDLCTLSGGISHSWVVPLRQFLAWPHLFTARLSSVFSLEEINTAANTSSYLLSTSLLLLFSSMTLMFDLPASVCSQLKPLQQDWLRHVLRSGCDTGR